MFLLLLISLFIAAIGLVWMNKLTNAYQSNDKLLWMILAFCIPVPALIFFYFYKVRNRKTRVAPTG